MSSFSVLPPCRSCFDMGARLGLGRALRIVLLHLEMLRLQMRIYVYHIYMCTLASGVRFLEMPAGSYRL